MNKSLAKKVVFTGGPCCGKTTLISEFKTRGFNVLEEVARQVLSDTDIDKKDYFRIQEEILRRQVRLEDSIKRGIYFLDRGVPDGLTYSEHYLKKKPTCFDNVILSGRYDYVFFLERLPLEKDGLRVESSDEEAEDIHKKILDTYRSLGYDLTYLPLFPGEILESVRKRADYVLQKINFNGLLL